MIVVVIIGLLAAVSIPVIRSMRIAANESSAIASLKAISAAEQMYFGSYGRFTYLQALGTTTPPYLNPDLTTEKYPLQIVKNGYQFSPNFYTSAWFPNNNQSFIAIAQPFDDSIHDVRAGVNGRRAFCVTEEGVIRLHNVSGADWFTPCNGEPVQ